MKTLIRFAFVMEALPHMDPVDPHFDHTTATRLSAFADYILPAASPQA